MLASKIKEIRNGRVIVKDSKIGDANPDGTISPDEEKRMAELLREANESKSRLKAKAYEIGGSFRGPGNWKRVKSILTSDSKTKDVSETVKTVPYKGFIITLYKNYSPRFGNMYYAKNNIGERYLDVPRFQTPEEAINWDKKNVDQYVSEQ